MTDWQMLMASLVAGICTGGTVLFLKNFLPGIRR